MKYLLDTNVLSVVARRGDAKLVARVMAQAPEHLAMSVVTRGEVEFGVLKHRPARDTLFRLRQLLELVATLPLGPAVVTHYAAVRHALETEGTPIGPNDTWIAAHAMSEGLILLSANEREFKRVPGLKVENWLR